MYNGGKIILGLIVFLAFATFPFYYNIGKVNAKPELKTDTPAIQEWVQKYGKKECIESKEVMRPEHMQILNNWRDSVVRNGDRIYVSSSGKSFNDESSEYLHELPFEQEEILRPMSQLYGCYALLLDLPYRTEGERVMSINRRQFLKLVGVSTVAGIGGTAVFNGLRTKGLEAAQTSPDPRSLNGKADGVLSSM